MADINSMIAKVELLDLDDVLENSFLDTEKQIIVYQQEQLLHGLDSTGKKIGKYKSDTYAAKKFQQNSLAGYGYKDERLTGAFYAGLVLDVRNGSLVWGDADPKTADILNRDGEDILGVSPAYAKEYSNNELKLAAIRRIKKIIYGMR